MRLEDCDEVELYWWSEWVSERCGVRFGMRFRMGVSTTLGGPAQADAGTPALSKSSVSFSWMALDAFLWDALRGQVLQHDPLRCQARQTSSFPTLGQIQSVPAAARRVPMLEWSEFLKRLS